MSQARNAGLVMKDKRLELKLTQADVVKRTQNYPPEEQITQSWLSKVERGTLTRQPDIRRMLGLGQIYGLSPTQIYELWGLPVRGLPREKAANARMEKAVRVFNDLPDGPIREQFLSLIDLAVVTAQAALAKSAS